METLVSPKFFLGFSSTSRRVSDNPFLIQRSSLLALCGKRRATGCRTRVIVGALGHGNGGSRKPYKFKMDSFASISSSSTREEATSIGVNPPFTAPPPPSYVGSPLFWIGVGVGISALFSWVATNLKKYAMQQAFKTMMGQMSSNNSQFSGAGFPPGPPFPFPPTSPSGTPAASPTPFASKSAVTVDVTASDVAPASSTVEVKEDTKTKKQTKTFEFVDISPEEVMQNRPSEQPKESTDGSPAKDVHFAEVSQNGALPQTEKSVSTENVQSSRPADSVLSVEALEKMMEDPTVQKMVYPYLPEEMRNPATFKWMLQNPQYRQQLEDMLNNMGGSSDWDNRMMDSLKNFDLSKPEVKQQFDQIGLTPEEVISKIMANPDVAMAFQNPKVQAAIMDCSQNPLSITKYQNDKEVMDVFNKISELFPGVTGPP
ncbi:hypothetical protein AMTRI_Chr11g157860 [Amborella trichopoda]